MRRFWLACASLVYSGGAAAQTPDMSPLLVELHLGAERVDAAAWRDPTGRLYVERAVLAALDIRAPESGAGPVALDDAPGLTYVFDAAAQTVTLTCTSACFAPHTLRGASDERAPVTRARGGFANADLSATALNQHWRFGGLFEIGLFATFGYGGFNWVAQTGAGAVRLETYWTFDDPTHRRVLRVGDSITRAGMSGVPVRFGGVQWGADFTLDPAFIPYPLPTLNGEAATPSTVDLYVDGALRQRDRVDAGPFAIVTPPLVSGGGAAQVVVTDALGRESVFAAPFYVSPAMLRPGLADYTLALGATRENFTLRSSDYGRAFASGFYRYGLSAALTGEASFETNGDGGVLGLGASMAPLFIGQIDLAAAFAGDGGWTSRAAWRRDTSGLSFGAELTASSAGYHGLGQERAPPPRFSGVASVGGELGELGAASIAYVLRQDDGAPDTRALTLTYSAPPLAENTYLTFNALYTEREADDLALSLGLFHTFGPRSAGARVESDRSGLSVAASAQASPEDDLGFGWRVDGRSGAIDRLDGAVTHRGAYDESALELSSANGDTGVRAQFATGLAWIEGGFYAARPIRESFALADVGAPGVRVLRDRRVVGVSDLRGRFLVTGLRPYEANLIGVALDDLPLAASVSAEHISAIPAARSGVVVHLGVQSGPSGEVRIAGPDGAPLPAGAILTRDDGARTPVGEGGRVFIADASAPIVLHADACSVRVDAAAVQAGRPLRCAAP